MTILINQLPNPLNRWVRRVLNSWRTLLAPGDLTVLAICVGLLLMPALALEESGWPLTLRTVLPVLVMSVILGFLLARSHYNELFSLLVSGVYGVSLILVVAAFNEPGSVFEGIYGVFTRVSRWLFDALGGGINQDDLVFTLLIAVLFWFLGYNVAWHIFRVDRVWRAVLPPGLILISNQVYSSGDKNLDIYLIIFMFLALLLTVRSNLEAREWEWYVQGIRAPRRLRQQFYRMGAVLALTALAIAWVVPSGDLQDRLNRFQEFMQSEPLTQLGELWNRLFAPADLQGPATADYYGSDALQLGGAIRLGEQTVMLVSAPPGRRYYWRSRVFDIYEDGRWTPAAEIRLSDAEAPLEIIHEPYVAGARQVVQQTFTLGLTASRLVYAAPQPVQIDLATRADVSYAPDNTMNVSVIRPFRVLYRGDSYTASSLVSIATASQLRAAGTDYPQWIRDLYLAVSPSVSAEARQLAAEVVQAADATTAYDQAKAIETWLRANIQYNETIPQPPVGVDPVDWVLFDVRQGYCNYYATAMIVMLRSQGIPARMAAGFAQGQWDAANSAYVVRERDAHTWVEVYFPGYGWVEFEPTAAQAPLNRADETQIIPQPTPTPQDTATPTPTATPTATPTGEAPTIPPQEGRILPTITPTFTPSPTATPVIVPTQPPPMTPQPRGPLAFILTTLGVAFLGLLFIALLVGLATFLWWWWEWRGLKGLSPVARAYARLERYMTLLGIRLGVQQTPEERRRRILQELPRKVEPPVTAITRMYTVERYGPGPNHPAEVATHAQVADEAWTVTRGSILARFLRRFVPWLARR